VAARLLYLTTPLLHGPDVLHEQGALKAHGFEPGPLTGRYNAATAAATRRAQRHYGLRVDGVLGPETRRALAGPKRHAPPAHPGREPPGELALAWMVKRLGQKEHPAGSNRCDVTREFGLVGPWCMMAVSLGFKHGANLILGDDRPHPWGYWDGRGFAFVPAFEAWAKTRGYWIGRGTPHRGDVVCFGFGHREPVHVGIVAHYDGGGQFRSVEGNTGVGSDSNGGEMMRRSRYVSQVVGFARVTHKRP
jgi:hypothetical protein